MTFMIKCLFVCLLSFSCVASYAQHDVPPTAQFEITGLVKKNVKFNTNDLAAFRADSVGDVVIKNKRGEQKSVARHMKGILLKAIIDSAGIKVDKPKEYGELAIIITASDGYINVYSWNELFNTEVGNKVYLITEIDGKHVNDMDGHILILSLADFNSGSRHLKGLVKIEIRKLK